jgi:membrane protein DedA with SNARE-associated domain
MAKVLGESARYVAKESIKWYQKQVIGLILVSCVFSICLGYFVGHGLTKQPYPLITFLICMLAIPIIVLLINIVLKKWRRKE